MTSPNRAAAINPSTEGAMMNLSTRAATINPTRQTTINPPTRAATVEVRTITAVESPLRCVWTTHPDHNHCCGSWVPARVVADAWRRELARGRTCAGFFHFAWRGEAWLAYGMPDGGVRGVYCPTHRAEREERLGYDPELVPTAGHAS